MEVEATGDEDDENETAATEEEFKEEDLDELEAMENERRQNNEVVDDEDLPVEEAEEEEDEDQYQSNFPYGGYGFGGFGSRRARKSHYNPWGYQQEQEKDTTVLEIGKYSMFTAAIRKNYQGVAYLLLQSGYDFMRAIQVRIF